MDSYHFIHGYTKLPTTLNGYSLSLHNKFLCVHHYVPSMCLSLCTQMLAKYTSLKFNALSTHLLNKEIVYFDKNALIVLLFYD